MVADDNKHNTFDLAFPLCLAAGAVFVASLLLIPNSDIAAFSFFLAFLAFSGLLLTVFYTDTSWNDC